MAATRSIAGASCTEVPPNFITIMRAPGRRDRLPQLVIAKIETYKSNSGVFWQFWQFWQSVGPPRVKRACELRVRPQLAQLSTQISLCPEQFAVQNCSTG